MASGGTKIYCPHCKEFRVCESVSVTRDKVYRSRPRRKFLNGIMAFLRVRSCSVCLNDFVTAEIPYESLKLASEKLSEIRTSVNGALGVEE